MAYKIDKDERKIEYNEEKKQFYIEIDQVQVADPSNFVSMVGAWEKQLQNALKFVENEKASLEAAKQQCELQHNDTLKKVKKEIENLQTSIKSFTPALNKMKEVAPEVFKEANDKLEAMKNKKKE